MIGGPSRNRTKIVFLTSADYKKVLALFGGLGPDGRGGAEDVLLLPWDIAKQAGWEQSPETVKELQSRIDTEGILLSDKARRVESLFDPTITLLSDPTAKKENHTWTTKAEELILSQSVTYDDLIPFDENPLIDDKKE